MSFELTFHDCSENYKLEVERFTAEFQNNLEFMEVQTSGSTGVPKKIMLSKKQLIASAMRTNAFFDLDSNASSLLCLSINTIGGKMVLVRGIVGNYVVQVVEPSREVLEKIPENLSFDFVSFAPIQFETALNKHSERLKTFSKAYLLGGSGVSVTLEKKSTELNLPVFVGFGMTETVSHIAIRSIESSTYSCLPGVKIHSTENGCCITDTLLDLTIKSTDMIVTVDNLQFSWLGRTDFVINSGGIKIHPELLEKSISTLISGNYAILGLPDEEWGEKCVLITDSLISELEFEGIQSIIRQEFGKYAVPKAVLQHSIPTINGLKINRKLLKEQLS